MSEKWICLFANLNKIYVVFIITINVIIVNKIFLWRLSTVLLFWIIILLLFYHYVIIIIIIIIIITLSLSL